MMSIIKVEEGIWILEEEGHSVLLKDCHKFGIDRKARRSLFDTLSLVAASLAEGKSLEPLIQKNLLKKLIRQNEAVEGNFWEVRAEGWGGRILFVMKAPDSIIVSAVDKAKGSLSQAINRGVKRWKNFLKMQERSQLPRHWG